MKFRIYTERERDVVLNLLHLLKYQWKSGDTAIGINLGSKWLNVYPMFLIIEQSVITICVNDILYFNHSPAIDTTINQLQDVLFKQSAVINSYNIEYAYLSSVKDALNAKLHKCIAAGANERVVNSYTSGVYQIEQLMKINKNPHEFI